MRLEEIVPVPYCVGRRAWECAYNLCAEWPHRLQQHEREAMSWLVAKGSPRLTWDECRTALHLHISVVGVRT